jgi:hypothetical protein
VCIVDDAVKEIENIARKHWSKGHATPVLAKAMDTKGLCNNRRIDAKEEAVRQACQTRDKLKIIRVLNGNGTKLGG